jgi:Secretion system C-terminal sorting domain
MKNILILTGLLLFLLFCPFLLLGQEINKVEYFFDSDPGYDNGLNFTIVPGATVVVDAIADLSSLEAGIHTLFVRAGDDNGRWSLPFKYPFHLDRVALGDLPDISGGEYFFDADPGYGDGIEITVIPDSEMSMSVVADLSSIDLGIHTLFTRFHDQFGRWSQLKTFSFIKENVALGDLPEVVGIEYFFDDDPGFGNAIQISESPATEKTINFTADISSLDVGFHTLYVRAIDNYGQFSLIQTHNFLKENVAYGDLLDIVELEYFIDVDPGYGDATSVTLTPGQDITFDVLIDLEEIGDGIHTLMIRAKDSSGEWTYTNRRSFHVEPEEPGLITAVEWEIVLDGVASNTATYNDFIPGEEVDLNFNADLSDLVGDNTYTMAIRGVDESGRRSLPYTHAFESVDNTDPVVALPIGDLTVDEDFSAFEIANLDTVFYDEDILSFYGDSLIYSFDVIGNTATVVLDSNMLSLNSILDATGDMTAIAIATDMEGIVASDTFMIQINPINDLPADFSLDEPADGAVLHADTVTVRWNPSSDVDNGLPHYRVEWSDQPDFSILYSATTADTFFNIENLEQVLFGSQNNQKYEQQGRGMNSNQISRTSEKPLISIRNQKSIRLSNLKIVSGKDDLSGDITGDELDEIPDDTIVYWRVAAYDVDGAEVYADNSLLGRSFSVDVFENPSVFTLTTPLNGDTVWVLEATLTWSISVDPDPYDNTNYDVWLGLLPDLSDAEMVAENLTETSLNITELVDDQTYFWTVFGNDSNTEGTWADDTLSFNTYLPEAPLSFELSAPSDEEDVHVDTVTVSWHPAIDPDPNDTFSYVVEWSLDTDFNTAYSGATTDTFFVIEDLTDVLTRSIGNESGVGGSKSLQKSSSDQSRLNTQQRSGPIQTDEFTFNRQPPIPNENQLDELPDDNTIFWRVKAVDSFELETWSDAGETGWSFNVDVFNSPLLFSLISPTVNDTCWTLDTTLTWNATSDPDPYDTPLYDVWMDTLADLSSAWLNGESLVESTVNTGNLLDDHLYYWTVHATDSNTDGTWASDTLAFNTYLPEAPMSFNLVAPDSGMVFPNAQEFPLIFGWELAEDPDPDDILNYTLVMSTDPEFTDSVTFEAGLVDTIAVDTLEQNIYWWRVYALDIYGLQSGSIQTWMIDVTLSVQDNSLFVDIPTEYEIASIYPNPFNPTLTAVIALPMISDLRVVIYNIVGREVAELTNQQHQTGYHSFVFDGTGLSSGVYFVHAIVPGKLNQVKKVVLMK